MKGRSFTLVEMLMVISIMAILGTLSFFGVRAILPEYRLNASTRMVRGDLYNAKMLAVKKNTPYRVLFSAPNYIVQEYNPTTTDWDEVLDRDFSAYEGCSVQSVTPGNPTFSPRGLTNATTTITLQNAEGDQNQISISISGRIRCL